MPFQIGCSHPSPQVMLRRVQEAKIRWAPSAIQVILPDYYAVTNEEALAFLRKVQKSGLVLANLQSLKMYFFRHGLSCDTVGHNRPTKASSPR